MLTISCGAVELSSTVQLHNNYEILWKLWMTKHFVPVYRCGTRISQVSCIDRACAGDAGLRKRASYGPPSCLGRLICRLDTL